ncbi:MAG: hypothetical protein ABIQ56_03495, partial [Chitinophagaceae bacterium]
KPEPASLVIEETFLLDSLPSGSGIAYRNDSLFIISDDAPFIYQLSLKDFGIKKIPYNSLDTNLYRIPKAEKVDLESVTIGKEFGKEYLLAFGSGSKSPARDSLLRIDLHDYSQAILSISDIYESMQASTNTNPQAWNIEGAAVLNDSLFLLNRGNNMVLCISMDHFTFPKYGPISPGIVLHHKIIKLPSISNHEARFSGLAVIDNERALFCASVEDTPDWISDGPILGSFIGILNLQTRQIISTHLLADSSGKPLIEKLESVEFISKNDKDELSIYAISDDDKGSSKLFKIRIPGK